MLIEDAETRFVHDIKAEEWYVQQVRPLICASAPEQCISGLGRPPSHEIRPPPMDPRHVPNSILVF